MLSNPIREKVDRSILPSVSRRQIGRSVFPGWKVEPPDEAINDKYTVLYLPFDRDFKDYSAGATETHTPTVTNVTLSRLKKINGKSGAFTDPSYVMFPYSADWALPSSFTIEFWVYFASTASGFAYFLGTIPASSAYYPGWFFSWNTASGLRFRHVVSSATWDVVYERAWTPSTGQWYHVALICRSNTYQYYIDGATYSTSGYDTSSCTTNRALYIGDNPGVVATIGVEGYIDNLRIHLRALDSTELEINCL